MKKCILFAAFQIAALAGFAQSTAFTYQGRLTDGANPATGLFDLRFALYDANAGPAQVGAALTNTATPVSNGLFAVTLDFGNQFPGANRWLEIGVRTNGSGAFSTLAQRQAITPTPYAIYAPNAGVAASVPAGSITGAMLAPGAVTSLGSPDGSPVSALSVNTNGWLGLGTNAPNAGLTIASGPTVLAPFILSETLDETGSFTNLAGAVSVAASGNLLAVAALADNAVTLVDITDPTAPVWLTNLVHGNGPFTNLTGAYSVAFRTNKLLAIAAPNDNAVTLVDAANGAAPVWRAVLRDGVGGFNDLANPRAVAFSGSILAIAAAVDNAVTLVDVSNPASPLLRSVLKDGLNGFTNLAGAVTLAFNGNLLVIGASGDSALTLVDVSNPASPVLRSTLRSGVGGFNFLDKPFGLAIQANLLAVSDFLNGAVSLIDVSIPTGPVLRSVISNSVAGFDVSAYPEGVAFNGNLLAIGTRLGGAVSLLDVANPVAPQRRVTYQVNVAGARYFSQPRFLAFAGTNLVVADAGYGAFSIVSPTSQAVGLSVLPWVGIGTDLPVAPLTVFGDVVVRQANHFDIEAHTIELGYYARAVGDSAVALGASSALRDYATASGAATANGLYSTAFGFATANGTRDTAVSDGYADGFNAFAAGNSQARGNYATALGRSCLATNNSLAAGSRAKAIHDGSFVWADGRSGDFATSGSNQFLIRAGGGLGVGVTNPAYVADIGGRIRLRNDADTAGLWLYRTNTAEDDAFVGMANTTGGLVGLWGNHGTFWGLVMNTTNGNVNIGNGAVSATNKLQVVNAYCNGTTWVNASDRNLKQNFETVDAGEILEKIVALPIQSWSYKLQPGEKHIGPVAQDFHAAFGLGDSERGITTVDEGGVALAAIQGLNQKLEAQRIENERLKTELLELRQKLELLVNAKR